MSHQKSKFFIAIKKAMGGSPAPDTYILSLQLERMEVMLKPTALEAGVNQVVTVWPLAACLEAGPRVTMVTNPTSRP